MGGWQKVRPRPRDPSGYGGVSYLCEGGRLGAFTRLASPFEAGSMWQGGVRRLGMHGSAESGGVVRPPVPEQGDRPQDVPILEGYMQTTVHLARKYCIP